MQIICPNCEKTQNAEPQETPQFPTSFVHFCECGEIIGESDIQEVKKIYGYTGAKDKEGNEIYEGDIVKNPAVSGVVRYVDSYCAFILCTDKGNRYEFSEEHTFMPLYLANLEICEVIGNIYENAELLEFF